MRPEFYGALEYLGDVVGRTKWPYNVAQLHLKCRRGPSRTKKEATPTRRIIEKKKAIRRSGQQTAVATHLKRLLLPHC